MKNRTILSSIVLAFLVSAFFMSVSTVFGAPTGQPPSGLTAPVFSGIDLQGVLKNTAGNVVVDDTLDIRNNIQNTTGDVKVGDTLDVSGGLDVTGSVTNGTNIDQNSVTIDDSLKVTKAIDVGLYIFNGSLGAVKINDTEGLMISGPLNVPSIENSVGAVPVPVTINDELVVKNALNVKGLATFDSHLSAYTIGAYSSKFSAVTDVAAGADGVLTSPACDAGTVLIDCSVQAYISAANLSESNYAFLIRKLYANYTARTCKIAVKNDYTGTRAFRVEARCFDPSN